MFELKYVKYDRWQDLDVEANTLELALRQAKHILGEDKFVQPR